MGLIVFFINTSTRKFISMEKVPLIFFHPPSVKSDVAKLCGSATPPVGIGTTGTLILYIPPVNYLLDVVHNLGDVLTDPRQAVGRQHVQGLHVLATGNI